MIRGYQAVKFRAPKGACRGCALRARCLRHPERTETRQVAFFQGQAANAPETFTAKMKRKIDSTIGRTIYGRRLGVVEPVFANIRSTKRLDRFTLRGQCKVDVQWKLILYGAQSGKDSSVWCGICVMIRAESIAGSMFEVCGT